MSPRDPISPYFCSQKSPLFELASPIDLSFPAFPAVSTGTRRLAPVEILCPVVAASVHCTLHHRGSPWKSIVISVYPPLYIANVLLVNPRQEKSAHNEQ